MIVLGDTSSKIHHICFTCVLHFSLLLYRHPLWIDGYYETGYMYWSITSIFFTVHPSVLEIQASLKKKVQWITLNRVKSRVSISFYIFPCVLNLNPFHSTVSSSEVIGYLRLIAVNDPNWTCTHANVPHVAVLRKGHRMPRNDWCVQKT